VAKNRIIFPKTSKRPPLRSGWTVLVSLRKNNPIFFTPRERGRNWMGFSILHAPGKRPELDGVLHSSRLSNLAGTGKWNIRYLNACFLIQL
jgi:hypothetical protein